MAIKLDQKLNTKNSKNEDEWKSYSRQSSRNCCLKMKGSNKTTQS
jgi:hypothetical protein